MVLDYLAFRKIISLYIITKIYKLTNKREELYVSKRNV